jgi:hypothetical protein
LDLLPILWVKGCPITFVFWAVHRLLFFAFFLHRHSQFRAGMHCWFWHPPMSLGSQRFPSPGLRARTRLPGFFKDICHRMLVHVPLHGMQGVGVKKIRIFGSETPRRRVQLKGMCNNNYARMAEIRGASVGSFP